ncbi:MAG: fatty acid desaturase family protein [Cytophagaceae bacterium]
MRTSKELILASREFAKEDRKKSWSETFITLFLLGTVLALTFIDAPVVIRLFFSILCSFLYIRMFIIYHDYQHHAILQKSRLAEFLMKAYGIYILTPQNIWKRSHDHHHNHNSKLTLIGIGSYPTISKKRFLSLTPREQKIYLINRHPLTIILGYFTLFIYWLNVKSFYQSPKKHWDSFLALAIHFTAGTLIFVYLGWVTFLISFFIPYFVAFAMGSYLFYCQHNFPTAVFCENHDWKYDKAALNSTSFMVMPKWLTWLTGNIGYHHVHHLNSRIPFYRLPEAMDKMPELQNPPTTSWNPIEMWRCFRVKLWDDENGKMIRLDQM